MNQWHNCPNLAAFWYNTISVVLYFYTLYTSGVRYHSFRSNINDPRFGQDWNENYLLVNLAAILLSSLLWLIFFFSSIFKTGSLANDYVEMNTYRANFGAPHISWNTSLVCRKILSRLTYQLLPFNSIIHIYGAFFLLVPIPLRLQEEIKHGSINLEDNPINYLLSVYSPELINFIMAAVSITVRLPTVFLSASTQISIIFSCVLFISNSYILIGSLFHQLLSTQHSIHNIIEIEAIDISLFLFCVFNYGFIYEMARTQFIDYAYSTQDQYKNNKKRPTTLRYWPNFMSAVTLIISIVINIYQCRYLSSTVPLFLFYLISAMLHYISWLIILLLFTFKIDWHFNDILLSNKKDFLCRNSSLEIHQHESQPTETMYTCFQANDGVRSASMGSSSRTHNPDFSPTSSSSGSRTSEKVPSFKQIPSISKQLDTLELNYEDSNSYRSSNRQGMIILQDITEENLDQVGYFKSPNISQRSSNVHSSDSGIGIPARDYQEYRCQMKSPTYDIARSRPTNLQGHVLHEYEINDALIGSVNICSDV